MKGLILLLLLLPACADRVEEPREITIKPPSALSAEARMQRECADWNVCDDLAAIQRQIYSAYHCN